jgi:uncharacterized membrane protein HdeD (DUF308 family)
MHNSLTERAPMFSLITGNWWAPVASGVLSVVLGAAALVWPSKTLEVLVWLFGVYAFLNGVIWLGFGLLAAGGSERWWSFVVNGIVGIGLGVLTFAEPQAITVALVSILGAWAIFTGVLEIVAAIRFRQVITNEWLIGLGGALSIVFGVLVLAQPSGAALTLVLIFGFYTVLAGIAQVVLGTRLRRLNRALGRDGQTMPTPAQRASQRAAG